MLTRRTTLCLATAAACLAMGGCLTPRPGGNMRSDDEFTYDSTPHVPLSITLIDTRDQTPIWEVDVPVGQRLVVQFHKDRAKQSSLNTPDLMRWEIYPTKAGNSPLRNAMPVPAANIRRLDVAVRPSPEYPREDDPYATVAIVPSTTGTPAYSPFRPGKGRVGTYFRSGNDPSRATVVPEPLEGGTDEAAASLRSGSYLSED